MNCDNLTQECSICLEHTNPEKDVKLSCNHTFHHKCAIQWLIENNTCPMCRKSIGINQNVDTVKYIILLENHSHLLNHSDLTTIYDKTFDIISIDDTDPEKIKWDSFNSINCCIKGGYKKNKKIISYIIHKQSPNYIIEITYIDYWQYSKQVRPHLKINTKITNNRIQKRRKY